MSACAWREPGMSAGGAPELKNGNCPSEDKGLVVGQDAGHDVVDVVHVHSGGQAQWGGVQARQRAGQRNKGGALNPQLT